MNKRQIAKLSEEIAAIDRKRRKVKGGASESGLTPAEQQFVAMADARGKKVYRSGWPDFLVIDKEGGGVVFVEVKFDNDPIRRSQVVMFEGIEEHLKLRVMIWDPAKPNVLTPWRSYEADPSKKSVRLRRHLQAENARAYKRSRSFRQLSTGSAVPSK